MPVPPKRVQDLVEGTVDHHASQACPDLQEVTIRWRGSCGYLTAWAGEGADNVEQISLCRIEYLGDEEDWGFAIYDPRHRGLHPGPAAHRAAHRRLRHRRHHPPRRLPTVTIAHRRNLQGTCDGLH